MKNYTEPSIRISKFGIECVEATDPVVTSMVEPTNYDMWKEVYDKAHTAERILEYKNAEPIW